MESNDISCVDATVAAMAEPQVMQLWPEGVPGLRADASAEKIVNERIINVHWPTLTVYAPEKDRANGTAVIYCPGGGYVRLAIGENGGPETQWLNKWGVTVFVLKYRMVEYGHPAPLQDVLRAVRIVRSRAAEFNVETDRIGILGASAGAHVGACAARCSTHPEALTQSSSPTRTLRRHGRASTNWARTGRFSWGATVS
jgi:acetyl esterase/lipase